MKKRLETWVPKIANRRSSGETQQEFRRTRTWTEWRASGEIMDATGMQVRACDLPPPGCPSQHPQSSSSRRACGRDEDGWEWQGE